jgi:hypothetical protein
MMRQVPLIASVVALVVAVAGCGLSGEEETKTESASSFPAPRGPKIVEARTVEEALPYARKLVANKSNFLGRGLGELKAGEKALLVTSSSIGASVGAETNIYIDAVMQALRERGVTPILMHDYEIVGVTREQAFALEQYMKAHLKTTSEDGWTEACWLFVGDKGYLEKTRPDLYEKCRPPEVVKNLPDELKPIFQKMQKAGLGGTTIPQHINAVMDKDPSIRGVWYGRGGPTWMSFHPHEVRWMGPFMLDNKYDVMTPAAEFPADVWMLSEEMMMEPLPSVDEVHVTDPEGTDVRWKLTEQQARNWAKGVYLRGHLFMFPQEAYGQYGLSVLNYPALDPEYIPVDDSVLINGKIVATSSHAGFFPKMTETWKDGYLVDVQGGGTYGEFIRTLMKQPGIHDTVWPQRKRPGWFQFFETALGTNPKIVRQNLNDNFGIAPERARDGVIHWAMGAIYWNDPGSRGGESTTTGKLAEFTKKTGLPGGHGFHKHTYFNTMKLHLRGSNKWVTLVDRGRGTSLNSPEVRALASRYGDPDKVLATEWVPEVPGVNAPGSFDKDYAQNPFKYALGVEQRVATKR